MKVIITSLGLPFVWQRFQLVLFIPFWVVTYEIFYLIDYTGQEEEDKRKEFRKLGLCSCGKCLGAEDK